MSAGEMLKHLREALNDGHIDDLERERLKQLANQGQQEYQDVINLLERDEEKEVEGLQCGKH